MKKKIFFYACFLLIGCFIGINIKEFKSKYVDASEEEKGLYIKYGERFPIETFNALGEKKNQKHGNTPLYKIWLYIDPNCESCIEKFPVVERLTEIMQGENIEIDILWRQEPKKTLVDTLDISKDKQYRTGSIKVLNEYPTYFITDEENSVQMISDDIDKIVKKMLSLDEIEKNAIIKETNIYLKKLIGQNDKQKQKLVYFAMDGCPDCQNVEKLLNDNSIASKYDMITIYTVDSKDQMLKNIEEYLNKMHGEVYSYRIYSPEIDLKNNGYKVKQSIRVIMQAGILFLIAFLGGMISIFELLFNHRKKAYGISLACGADYRTVFYEMFAEVALLNGIGMFIGIGIGYIVTYFVDMGIMIGYIKVEGSIVSFIASISVYLLITIIVSGKSYIKIKQRKVIELLNGD